MLACQDSETERRRRELSAYLTTHVDDGTQLVCVSAARCRASMRPGELLVEGQLSHIGPMFDLVDDGRPLRILIVSKQVGGSLADGGGRGHEHVTIEERRAQVDSAKAGTRPHPRTNHMVGSELALKVLAGLEADADPQLTFTDGRRAHVFDCMALTNATLCSRASGDASGQGSDRMFELCRAHLAESIRVLQPTVVVAQGWTKQSAAGNAMSVASTVARALGVRTPSSDPALTVVRKEWGSVALVTAYHPARHWFSTSSPYWRRLEPVLREARSVALGRL